MVKPRIIMDKGREKYDLTILSKKLFDQVQEYNKAHKDNPLNIMTLVRDNNGGASFFVGSVEMVFEEYLEMIEYSKAVALFTEMFLKHCSKIISQETKDLKV